MWQARRWKLNTSYFSIEFRSERPLAYTVHNTKPINALYQNAQPTLRRPRRYRHHLQYVLCVSSPCLCPMLTLPPCSPTCRCFPHRRMWCRPSHQHLPHLSRASLPPNHHAQAFGENVLWLIHENDAAISQATSTPSTWSTSTFTVAIRRVSVPLFKSVHRASTRRISRAGDKPLMGLCRLRHPS